jgi:predicted HicB family RNase H-like nuclease
MKGWLFLTKCGIIDVYGQGYTKREPMEAKIMIRLPRELREKVREKANREAVNLSLLIRNWLIEWVEEDSPKFEKEENS